MNPSQRRPARRSSDVNHGLGLSIVEAVVGMHGDRVFARSADGWNTFGFTLAAAPSSA